MTAAWPTVPEDLATLPPIPQIQVPASQNAARHAVKYERRSHCKSRHGCTTCKTRKIKCGEEQPRCLSCRLRGTECHYPSLPDSNIVNPGYHAFALCRNPPTETLFSIRDLQYFHHFLTTLSHPLPLGNKSVWLHEIPKIAHHHAFLLYAMFALSVADLATARSGVERQTELLQYRGKAISGLQKAINDTSAWAKYGHVDAILSASYILVYQSALMPDGDKDFGTFAHGCALITLAIQQRKLKTVLKVGASWPVERLADALALLIPASLPDSVIGFIKCGISHLDSVREPAHASPLHPFWSAQYEMCLLFTTDPRQAYISSLNSFGKWFLLAQGLLSAMRNPTNGNLALIMIATFLANITWSKVLIPLYTWNTVTQKGLPRLPAVPLSTIQEAAQWIEAMDIVLPETDRAKLNFSRTTLDRCRSKLDNVLVQDNGADVALARKVATLNDLSNKAHIHLGSILRIGADLATWFEDALLSRYMATTGGRSGQ